jgi:transposase InsO family protein
MQPFVLYNSEQRKKVEFVPRKEGQIDLYVCGMTVYDYCHIGHARTVVAFDYIIRFLRSQGWQVKYVRNITDIDDKIIKRANENGESCGINRVHRLMKANGLKSQRGYRKPRAHAGVPAVVAANTLDRQFNPTQPNQLWVTDITYIRTHEGWLYLAVVIDLFSRLVVGWSMKSRITADLVLDALLMALWRRNPKNKVLIHSDQGSQYTSHEWQTFLKHHNLESSMSRRLAQYTAHAMTMLLQKASSSY